MPLVNVHGITGLVLPDPAEVVISNSLYRECLVTTLHDVSSASRAWRPWWGRLVAPSLKAEISGVARYNPIPEVLELDGDVTSDRILLTAAKNSLQWAVDLLCSALTHGTERELEESVFFCMRATEYWAVRSNLGMQDGISCFAWLGNVTDDTEFLEQLACEVASPNDRPTPLPWAVRVALRQIRSWTESARNSVIDSSVHDNYGRYKALMRRSALCYLASRSDKGDSAVGACVSGALDEAAETSQDLDSPLVVIAHDLGGNIVADVLAHLRPHLQIDLMVTVGTPMSLLNEMSHGRVPVVAPSRLNVRRWINAPVPSTVDGSAATSLDDGAEDLNPWGGFRSFHGTFSRSPQFYYRLAHRIAVDQSQKLSPVN